MIHGTWKRDDDGEWAVWIPHDTYWGDRAPRAGDTVLVTRKDGTESLEKLDTVIEVNEDVWVAGWLCSPLRFDHNDHDDSGLDHDYEYDQLGVDPGRW